MDIFILWLHVKHLRLMVWIDQLLASREEKAQARRYKIATSSTKKDRAETLRWLMEQGNVHIDEYRWQAEQERMREARRGTDS